MGGVDNGNMELTKQADKALHEIYAQYRKQLRNGISERRAVVFDTNDENNKKLFSEIEPYIYELKSGGFIKAYLYGDIELTAAGKIYVENIKHGKIGKLWEFLKGFVSALLHLIFG